MPGTLAILLVIFYLFAPLGIIYLTDHYRWINKLGAILVVYIVGFVLGFFINNFSSEILEIQEILVSVSIIMAIPLMLFSSDIKKWTKLAPKGLLSLLLGVISLVIIVITGYKIFSANSSEEFVKVGGMLVGVYTGGTPNLAALKMVLNVSDELFLVINSYDMLLSAVYLFFLMSVGNRVFNFFLTRSRTVDHIDDSPEVKEVFWGLMKKKRTIPLLKVSGLSVLIVGLSLLIMYIVPDKIQMMLLVLSITTLSIGASFFKWVNKTERSFELGMYLILIFSLVIASKVNINSFKVIDFNLFYYMTYVVFATLTLHVVLSKLFKVDSDTIMITSTALICSPPFVPVVASAIKNKSLIIPGLTIGIIGYAIGNYLGILISQLLTLL